MRAQTPRGVKDLLPADVQWRQQLEAAIRQAFSRWGYHEVETPTFEYFETFNRGQATFEQAYTFLDQDGQLLALRSDLTTPIARMVASRLRQAPKPLRLAYAADTFRYDAGRLGAGREQRQAGVELIGAAHPAADAEAIAFAAVLLASLGVAGAQFDIGHGQFLHGLMQECPVQAERVSIRRALVLQDYVELQRIVRGSGLPDKTKDLLCRVDRLRGGPEVIDYARGRTDNAVALAALDNLAAVCERVAAYGIESPINIDLSIAKALDYYTGMVLEGYAPELGALLVSGGRYDGLHAQFGEDVPAVGFALELEAVMLVLEAQGCRPALADDTLFAAGDDHHRVVQYAMEQRAAGRSVELDVENLSFNEAQRRAAAKGLAHGVYVSESGLRRW